MEGEGEKPSKGSEEKVSRGEGERGREKRGKESLAHVQVVVPLALF